MQSRMMHRPLRIIDILTHAAEVMEDQGIVLYPARGLRLGGYVPDAAGRGIDTEKGTT